MPYTPLMSEVLDKVAKAKTKAKKIELLRQHNTDALRMVLKSSFDPRIEWDLPEGDVPYTPNEAPEGTEHNMLVHEARTLYHYIKGGNPKLTQNRRENMFIQLLEGLHRDEAEIVVAAKNERAYAHAKFPRALAHLATSKGLRNMFWGAIQHHYDGKIPFYGTGEDTEEWSVGQQDGQPAQGIQPVASGTKEPLPPEMQGSRFTDGYKDQYARRDVAKIVRQRKAKQMRLTSRGQLRKIQQMLVDAGFLKREIKGRPQVDGSYGYNTMLAIEKFQNALVSSGAMPQEYAPGKSNVDGLAGRRTIKALKAYSK